MEEQALSMTEVKEKLLRLGELIPKNSNELLLEFGRYLASYLNPELVPSGFLMACLLAIHDLQQGVNGFTGQRIRSSLVGYPSMIYSLLQMEIPQIADAVLPAEFATSVKTLFEESKNGVAK